MPYNYDQFITEYLKEKENSITDDNLRPVFSLFQKKLLLLLNRTKLLHLLAGKAYRSEGEFTKDMTVWFLHHQDKIYDSYMNDLICNSKILKKEFHTLSVNFNVLNALLYNWNKNFYQKKFPDIPAESIATVRAQVGIWAAGILIRWKKLTPEERKKLEIPERTKAPSKKQVTWWDQEVRPETIQGPEATHGVS